MEGDLYFKMKLQILFRRTLYVVIVRLFHGIIVLIGFSLYISSVRKIFVIVHVFSYEFLEEHVTK
jgi:hypothetical protein